MSSPRSESQVDLPSTPLLLASAFIIATCGLIYELLAGTLASYLLGDSVLQFSTVIGTYLFAMGIGSYLSQFFKKNLYYHFILLQYAIGALGGFSATILFASFSYDLPFGVMLYSLVFLIGSLVGMEIPLLLRILKEEISFEKLIAQVLTLDYVGALLASLIFPLFLAPRIGVLSTSFLIGLVNTALGAYLATKFKSQRTHLLALAFFIATSLIAGLFYNKNLQVHFEQKLYSDPILHSQNSMYQHIAITANAQRVRLWLNNHLQFSSDDEYRYHEALVAPAVASHPDPQNALVLGGGDGLAVDQLLQFSQIQEITLVDLDPQITELFQTNKILTELNHNALNNPKVTIVNQDAFTWLRDNKKKFDLVIIDFPDPTNYSVGKLYTTTFFQGLAKDLSDDGVLCIQSSSPLFAPRAFWCVFQTLQESDFHCRPLQVFIPSFGIWGYVLASKNPQQIQDLTLPQGRSYRFLNDQAFASLFLWSQDMARPENLQTQTLFNQPLIQYHSQDWSRWSQGR